MSTGEDIARSVLEAYGLGGAELQPIHMGLMNQTYAVLPAAPSSGHEEGATTEHRRILQRIHHTFGAAVNGDIDAITAHVASKGMVTPRVVRTTDGALWVNREDGVWRMLTWVAGKAHHTCDDPAQLRSAGALVGRFHTALLDLPHRFAFERPGPHDTKAHLERLAARLEQPHPLMDQLRPVAEEVLSTPRPTIPSLPRRLVHGDLKLSNLLFDGQEAHALVDLDTLQWGELQAEMGDAMRSWCNPRGEDAAGPVFSVPLFEAAMEGYLSVVSSWITDGERAALREGPWRIALELASRFCLDAFEETYFAWDRNRFDSAREHNVYRARGQLQVAMLARENALGMA